MRRLTPLLLLVIVAGPSWGGCAGDDGPPGPAPLTISTLVAVPPVVPVGVQALVAATVGNGPDDGAFEVEWTVTPADLALVHPSSCRALFFQPLEAGVYDVRVRVVAGDRVAEGQVFVQAAAAGSGVAQTDADQDGLFDAWELVFFGRDQGVEGTAPGADPDGDGRDNQAEQEDGTDPTVPDAAPVAGPEGAAA